MSNIPVPMEGFGGGGGAPLNFKVVGNPQPSSPKENTIWVNTDVKITGHYFQAEQPEEMAEGEVWISTGTESQVAFNALKKGTVMVYPLAAKQMVGGTLVDVTAKSWQNGEWVDWYVWNGELFDNGEQFEKETGGWVNDSAMGTAAIVGGKMVFGGGECRHTAKQINTGGKYKTLHVYAESATGTYNYRTVCLTNKKNDYSGGVLAYVKIVTGENSIDISSVNVDFWVEAYTVNDGAMTISRIWME